jgi:hypothetical protein
MNKPRLKALLLLSLATLSASALAQNADPASPGTINYVEGSASIQERQLNSNSVGHEALERGQYLSTTDGKVEVLLTPGIFLRLDNDTTIQMISPDLTHTEIKLERGRADVEVDQIFTQNLILIDQQRGQTQLLKSGFYAFNADIGTVRVISGEASIFPGADLSSDVKPVKLKADHELALNNDAFKPQKFDKDHAQDDLYNWSSLRSQYLGQANIDLASDYAGSAGFNPGWYWAGDPYGYTWLPGSGLFWNPFGYGFYSPYYLYGGGLIYGRYGYGGGYGYRGGYYATSGRVSSPSHSGFSPGTGGNGFHGGGGGGASHGGGGGHR